MEHLNTMVLGEYLKLGSAVSIGGNARPDVAATIQAITADRVRLSVPRPGNSNPFQTGDSVELKYWDEGATIYRWPAEVIEAEPGNQNLSLSLDGQNVSIQRRKSYRVRAQIPLSATIISARDPELTGQHLDRATTENLTVGGLLFKTDLPLTVGDKLECEIDGGKFGRITALGWVIRTGPERETGPRRPVAVQFLQLDESDQRNLTDFLRSFY